jgi:2-methylcitrate dehydratase
MTIAEELASFVVRVSYDDMSYEARHQMKIRILDSLGCAIAAVEGEPIRYIRQQIEDFGGREHSTLIGGGRTSSDRAAFYNSALTRYLDFNDFYLAEGESCHPSDNLGAVLAALEYAGGDGADLMTALAVSYQVQARISDEAPVRHKGFDHTTQGAYAVAAGVAKALGLDANRTANAVALAGTPFNALRVTRTGALSHWKGLAYPSTAFTCTHAAFLAMRGVTGPPEVFEGNKGFMDSIAGPFEIDWSKEDLERVVRTAVKKYNAEGHSQQSIEGVLELQAEHGFTGADVERIEIDTFAVAYNIIGGGEEGDKTVVESKEQADHSLHYMVAVAILDGQVMPEQYEDERIKADDVQALLRKLVARPIDDYSARFPDEMVNQIRVYLRDGRVLTRDKTDYEGFHSNPMRWETVEAKFDGLCEPYTDAALRGEIVDAVRGLESVRVEDFAGLLARVNIPRG